MTLPIAAPSSLWKLSRPRTWTLTSTTTSRPAMYGRPGARACSGSHLRFSEICLYSVVRTPGALRTPGVRFSSPRPARNQPSSRINPANLHPADCKSRRNAWRMRTAGEGGLSTVFASRAAVPRPVTVDNHSAIRLHEQTLFQGHTEHIFYRGGRKRCPPPTAIALSWVSDASCPKR